MTRTVWVDKDGLSGANTTDTLGSDSAWTMATRVDDATKPFATVAAAIDQAIPFGFGSQAGDVIRVMPRTSGTYAKPTIASKNPANVVVIELDPTSTRTGVPIAGWQFTDCSRLTLRKWTHTSTQFARFIRCHHLTFESVVTSMVSWLLDNGCPDFTFDRGCKISNVGSADSPAAAINCRPTGAGNSPGAAAARYDRFSFHGWIDNVVGDVLHFPNTFTTTPHTDILLEDAIFSRCGESVAHSDSFQLLAHTLRFTVRRCLFYESSGKVGLLMPEQNAANDPGTGSGQSTGLGKHVDVVCEFNVATGIKGWRFFNCPDLTFDNNTIFWLGAQGQNHGFDARRVQGGSGGALVHPAGDGTTIKSLKRNILGRIDIGGDSVSTSLQGVTYLTDAKGGNVIATGAIGGEDGYTLATSGASAGADTTIAAATINSWFVDPTYDASIGKHPDMRIKAAFQETVGDAGAYPNDTEPPEPPYVAPVTNFTLTPNPVTAGNEVLADAATSTGDITQYEIDWDYVEGSAVITHATSTRGGGTGASSYSTPLTVVAGDDRHLMVTVTWRRNSSQDCTGVTFNGVALTLVGGIGGATGDVFTRVELWEMVAPPLVTANVVVTMSASTSVECGATVRTGVHQTVPRGTLVTASGNSSTATATATSADGERVVDGIAAIGTANGLTVGAGQAQRTSGTTGSGGAGEVRGATSDEAGAASVPMTWALAVSNRWNIAAVPLKPAASTEGTGYQDLGLDSTTSRFFSSSEVGSYTVQMRTTGPAGVDTDTQTLTVDAAVPEEPPEVFVDPNVSFGLAV